MLFFKQTLFIGASMLIAKVNTMEHVAAATTVLARPLGGYGLAPLVFEPILNHLAESSSNSVLTKVRKSAVYEQMNSYEDDHLPTLPVAEITGKDVERKTLDFAPLGRAAHHESSKPAISAASSNAYGSFNSMFKGFGGGGGDDMPSYKEDNYAPQQTYAHNEPLAAAIKSMRTVEVKELQDDYQNAQPQVIDIAPSALPIVINFRTSASAIKIHQTHERGEPTEVQQTQSEDEPQFLKHQVTKPVIQEVHEIIMPYRKIIQEIRPVEEEIKTVVARGRDRNAGGHSGGQQHRGSGGGDIDIGGGHGGGHSGGGYSSGGSSSGGYQQSQNIGTINLHHGGAGAALLGGPSPTRIKGAKFSGFSKKAKY